MLDVVKRWITYLIGDYHFYELEHRLFNTVTLMNGVINLGGAFTMIGLPRGWLLFSLHIVTGILFLLIYGLSRKSNNFEHLYWPFVLLILTFLFVNIMGNAGSLGGAHYYLIAGLVISVVLARCWKRTLVLFFLFSSVSFLFLYIERHSPEWITLHVSSDDRWFDIVGNFIFVQVLIGVTLMIFSKHLENERQRSEELLLNILPQSIAKELKRYGYIKPQYYESVTVIFVDVVGFTKMASALSSKDLVEQLGIFFREFDSIVSHSNIEKIKTIGDAYMAAGGVPLANHTHPLDTVLLGLEMRNCMDAINIQRVSCEHHWQVRIGIHTGPLSAGVIGRDKFVYDLWGDTVNMASRMESHGVPSEINISIDTYELIKDYFVCESRGILPVKHRGEVEMFLVKKLKRNYSQDDLGYTPNDAFWEAYEKLKILDASSETPVQGIDDSRL